MVNSESEVLPSDIGIPTDEVAQRDVQDGQHDAEQDAVQDNDDSISDFDDIDSLFRSRASRPSNDDGWLDCDHYSKFNSPANLCADSK